MRPNSFAAVMATATVCAAATSATAQSSPETHATIFDAVAKTVSEQFYDPAFHGVSWTDVHARYRARLGEVANDAQLQRLEPIDGIDTVLDLAPLSDARAKGLQPGDRIVDGVAALNGPAGTVAEVKVQRSDTARGRARDAG